jgi:hypothetical protein
LSPEKGANESFPYIDTSDLPLALSDVANNVSLSRMHTVTQWINKQLDNALLYAGKDRPQEIKDAGCAMRRLYAAVNGNWSQMAAEDRDEPARFVPN